ncbi:hypothetical protein NF556_18730 [Ornithinimicrobium faecis]|uniref:Uncharacterized protein n=1 Tax=Ornithinimicrobium faecis TaxID=2934158 RepID=A0ABY4YTX5_9MICO|nr:hypothetical protein [Ornithinimicrobium sp. HY1793]USQ79602.1 hypothetical protein NF556_18730 [Ornithinimicrobium sp. HY1793]
MKIKDPHGQTWRVTRRWVPWRRKLKGTWERMPELPSGDDPISMILTVIMLILCLPVLILALVASLEFLLILLLLPFVILRRIIFGQHWTIEARLDWTPVWEEAAGSWSDSGRAIQDVATAIQRGHLPPHNIPVD